MKDSFKLFDGTGLPNDHTINANPEMYRYLAGKYVSKYFETVRKLEENMISYNSLRSENKQFEINHIFS